MMRYALDAPVYNDAGARKCAPVTQILL